MINSIDIETSAASTEITKAELFACSILVSARDNEPGTVEFPWCDFVDGLKEPEVRGPLSQEEYADADRDTRAKQKDGPAWIAATFVPGSTRSSSNVTSVTAFVGDIDDGKMSADEIADLLSEWGCVIHSSYSNTPENPKYRVIVKYDQPVTPDEHRRLWDYFNDQLGKHLDPAAKDPGRLYYLPACPPGAEDDYQFFEHGGATCSPHSILKRLDEEKKAVAAVLAPLYPVPAFPSTAAPPKRDTNSGEEERAPSESTSDTLRRIAHALSLIPPEDYKTWIDVGMALKNHLRDDGLALYHDWSKSSDKFDPAEVERKWESFKVGGGLNVGTIFHIAKRYSAIAPVESCEFEEMTDLGIQIEHDAIGIAKYPVEVLGEVLCPAALKINETVQAPLPMCGQSLLSAISLAVQAYANVKTPDGREMPTSLFVLTIGESGERKSRVDKCALKPVRAREFELEQEYRRKQVMATLELKGYEAKKQEIVDDEALTFDEVETKLIDLGEPPEQPRGHQLLISEPTFEGLFKLFLQGQPSMGIFSDEGGRMVGGHGMSKDNALKMAAGLSSLWDASPLNKTTSGEGSATLRNRRLSMHLMMQPLVAKQLLGNEIFRDQGLLARCLICQPTSTIGFRTYRPVDPCATVELHKYHERLKAILDRPHKTIEGDAGHLEFRLMTLSADARNVFVAFTDWVEGQLAPSGRYRYIRGFGAKAAEQATRIAGVLSLFDNIENAVVERVHMVAGASLALYALEEALRHCSGSTPKQVSAGDSDVNAVIGVISRRGLDEFATAELARHVPPRLRLNERLIPVLESMCTQGLLERLEPDAGAAKNQGVTWRHLCNADAA